MVQGAYLMTGEQGQLTGGVVGGEKDVSPAVAVHGGDDFLEHALQLGFPFLPSSDAVETRTAAHPQVSFFVCGGAPGVHDVLGQGVELLPLWVIGEDSLSVSDDEAAGGLCHKLVAVLRQSHPMERAVVDGGHVALARHIHGLPYSGGAGIEILSFFSVALLSVNEQCAVECAHHDMPSVVRAK